MTTFSENCLSVSRLEIPGVIIDAQRKRAHTLGSYDTTSKVTTSESSSSCLAAEHQTVIIFDELLLQKVHDQPNDSSTSLFPHKKSRQSCCAMEKTEDFNNQNDGTIMEIPYGMMLREISKVILVVAYFYLRHGKEYFDLVFGNIYMIPIYCFYLWIAADVLIDYLTQCKNGDAMPVCAIKSGTFRDCRCPEEERE